MSAKGIHHIALTVNQWEEARDFYLRLSEEIGAKPFIDTKGAPHADNDCRVLILAGDGFMYSIWEARPEFKQNNHRYYSVGLHHFAFAADSPESVDRLYKILQDIDADIIDPPQEYDYVPGYYALFFCDPDGMKLEYAYVPD